MPTKIPYVKNPDGSPGEVWNPIIGCTRIKSGCHNCWAERLHDMRYKAWFAKLTDWTTCPKQDWKPFSRVQFLPNRLQQPLHWRKPRTIFVCSMSDIFHKDVPFEFIDKMFAVMAMCPQHKFLLFTKRWERAAEYYRLKPDKAMHSDTRTRITLEAMKHRQKHGDDRDLYLPWPLPNIHLYFSASTQPEVDEAVPILLNIPVAVRGLSLEPLLGPVDFSKFSVTTQGDWWGGGSVMTEGGALGHIGSIIVGCESGPNRRLCDIEDIKGVAEQCKAAGVPCYVKQIPIAGKCVTLNENTGAIWPAWAVREMPK